MMKHIKNVLLKSMFTLVSLCICVAILLGSAFFYFNRPAKEIAEKDYVFRISKGETVSIITRKLKETQIIRSELLLKIVSRIMDTEREFKAGYYRIPRSATSVEIHNLLISQNRNEQRVTFPEGWTIKKIGTHLEEKKIITHAEFVEAARSREIIELYNISGESLEGYLFPDTYFFPQDFSAPAVVDIMVTNFFKNLEEIVPEYRNMEKEELQKKIIMASVVEREYRVPDEAPRIASVFYNRLRWNIGLESCATLEYIITEIQEKPHPEYITLEDKKIESAYNTYMWAGLPPGPISNPGRIALNAAFHPAQEDYLYFLLKEKNTGEHYFSKDLDEHNKAKIIYLKRIGSGN